MQIAKTIYHRISFVAKMSENIKKEMQRAQRVQDNVLQNQYTIQMEAKIRSKVTIQSSIQQMETQMNQEIARSLKRAESKVVFLIKKAQEKYQQHKKAKKTDKEIQDYNHLVKECEKARWEFMVQRQAVGFTIKNYEIVTSLYKIPPRIE